MLSSENPRPLHGRIKGITVITGAVMVAGSNFLLPNPLRTLTECFSDRAPDSCWGQAKSVTLGGELSADVDEIVQQIS